MMSEGDDRSAPEGPARSDPDRRGDPQCTALGEEIGQLLVGWGDRGSREVRIGLRREVLPDTTIRILESDGALCVELTIGAEALRDWVAARLEAVAADVGQRLGRDLSMYVMDPGGVVTGRERWNRR